MLALSKWLQGGSSVSHVSYKVDLNTVTKYSPPDHREVVFVLLVASNILVIKHEDQVAILPEVLANSNVSIESRMTKRHTS